MGNLRFPRLDCCDGLPPNMEIRLQLDARWLPRCFPGRCPRCVARYEWVDSSLAEAISSRLNRSANLESIPRSRIHLSFGNAVYCVCTVYVYILYCGAVNGDS